MILVPALVRIGKRKELHGLKKIEDIWTTAYCTFLKVKDSDLIIAFGLNNCFQLGAEQQCSDSKKKISKSELSTVDCGVERSDAPELHVLGTEHSRL